MGYRDEQIKLMKFTRLLKVSHFVNLAGKMKPAVELEFHEILLRTVISLAVPLLVKYVKRQLLDVEVRA
jgi:hypothetical protein